jgi:hypothetical protein
MIAAAWAGDATAPAANSAENGSNDRDANERGSYYVFFFKERAEFNKQRCCANCGKKLGSDVHTFWAFGVAFFVHGECIVPLRRIAELCEAAN